MQEELQLRHLSRYEKKRLVKEWHAMLPSSNEPLSALNDKPSHGDDSSLIYSRLAAPPGALAFNNEQLLKTSGHVKRAYRSRARKQEAHDRLKVIERRKVFGGMQMASKERKQDVRTKKSGSSPSLDNDRPEDDASKAGETADLSKATIRGELQVLDLPADEVVTNVVYRNEVLRRIRHQLANGGKVLLQSECFRTSEATQATRLMLQTLCTQSLAYCARDQNVVPEILDLSSSVTRLSLRLTPRYESSA